MAAEADSPDVRETIEAGLAQLKGWLEIQLQHQNELLHCISHEVYALTQAGELQGTFIKDQAPPDRDIGEKQVAAEAKQTEALRAAAKVEHKSRFPSKESIEILPLPGAIFDGSTGSPYQVQVHDSSACCSSQPGLDSILGHPGRPEEHIGDGALGGLNLPPTAPTDLPPTSARDSCQGWQSLLVDIFDHLDFDQSGSISLSELKQAFREVGIRDVEEPLKVLKADTTGDGVIDRVEWLHMIEDAAQGTNEDVVLLREFLDRLTELQYSQGSLFFRERYKKPRLILRHDSPWRMAWDLVLCIMLFYVSVSVPFTLGFGENDALEKVDLATDVFFCCDVVLNFRTSFMDREGSIIFDAKLIALNYLKSWFLLDLFSSVPFDAMTAGLLPNLTPARLLKIGKISKVMKLLRIGKTLTAVSESEFMESVDYFLTSKSYQTYARLVKLVVVMFVAAHWLACFGSAVDTSSIDAYFADGIEPPSELKKYLAGMYWSMTTLSTVGYGDITPKTDEERAYAIIAMVIGGALYGYVIGSVTSLVTERDVRTNQFHHQMELVYSWLDTHYCIIPAALRRRLRNYFKRTLAARSVMDDTTIVRDLSPELRADIAFFIVHEKVRQHSMFIRNPNSTLAKLVEVLRSNHVMAYEKVVRVGDPGTAMYILVDGLARYEEGSEWFPRHLHVPAGQRFQQVAQGDSFGEEIIFHMEETYCYTIAALKVCDFHSIGEDEFKSKYKNMPELREQMYRSFMENKKERARVQPVSIESEKAAEKTCIGA